MGFRASLHFRINASVLISFAWLAFLLGLLTLDTSMPEGQVLLVLLLTGLAAAAVIGYLWAEWALRLRKA